MKNKAFIKYIVSLLLFGFNGICASQISLTSAEIVFLSTFIGSALLAVLFFVRNHKFTVSASVRKDIVLIILSGIAMGVSWLFLYEAYQLIGVGLASLLYYCGPVIVMMLSPILFSEKFTLPKIIGFIAVLVGIFFVNGDLADTDGNAWGLLCGMLSAVAFFLMVVLNKFAKRIKGLENSLIQLTVSFLTVAVYSITRQGFLVEIPAASWPWIITLGVVNTGIGCYLYFSSIGKLHVQTVAACGYIEPLSAVIFASLLLGEKMTALQIVGAILIIGGAMIGELVKIKKPKA